jgi:hypothetical protein
MSRSKTNTSPGGSPAGHAAASPKTPSMRKESASHGYSNFAAQLEMEGGPYSPTLYASRSAADVGYNLRSGPPPLLQEGSFERHGRVGSARGPRGSPGSGGGFNSRPGSAVSPVKHGRPGTGAGGGQRRPSAMGMQQELSINLPTEEVEA